MEDGNYQILVRFSIKMWVSIEPMPMEPLKLIFYVFGLSIQSFPVSELNTSYVVLKEDMYWPLQTNLLKETFLKWWLQLPLVLVCLNSLVCLCVQPIFSYD